MKFFIAVTLIAVANSFVDARINDPEQGANQISGRVLQEECNFMDGASIVVNGGCNFDNFVSSSTAGCSAEQLVDMLGSDSEEEAQSLMADICQNAISENDDYDPTFSFEKVMNKGYIWDQNFFAGGTAYNSVEDSTTTVAEQSVRLAAVADSILTNQVIGFPNYLPNFSTCEASAAMCCYTASKQEGGEPTDNTDVCDHDMANSARAARVRNGRAIYTDEGNAYCEGFAWDDSSDGPFKGNTLFEVAMKKGFMENQRTRALPGAPMCGCIESMPTVSRAACTNTVVTQTFTVHIDDTGTTTLEMTNLDLSFGDCDGKDLSEYYSDRFGSEGKDISSQIVGECPTTSPLVKKFYKRQENSGWTPVVGKGLFHFFPMDSDEFRNKVNEQVGDDSHLRIIRRKCASCDDSHKEIFYKRLTPVPDDIDLLDILKNNWFNKDGNRWHDDFELYSSYEDALSSSNPWTWCNFNDAKVGFPRDCGPNGRVNHNWNSYVRGGGRAYDSMFYIEG